MIFKISHFSHYLHGRFTFPDIIYTHINRIGIVYLLINIGVKMELKEIEIQDHMQTLKTVSVTMEAL